MEGAKTLGILGTNGTVLALSFMQHVDQAMRIGQMLLVFASIGFTGLQIVRTLHRMRREAAIEKTIDDVRKNGGDDKFLRDELKRLREAK